MNVIKQHHRNLRLVRAQPILHGNGVAVGLGAVEEVDGLGNVVNVLELPGKVLELGPVARLNGDLRRLLEVEQFYQCQCLVK